MAEFTVEVQATSNTSANTEDEFIEISGAASTGFFLKRVEISCNTPNSDVDITGRIVKLSAVGASASAGTSVQKRPTSPTATSTVKVKNSTNAFYLGSVTSTFWQTNVNGRAVWAWIPRGNEEYIDSGSAGIIAVVAKVSSASIVLNVNAEYEE